MPYEISEHLRGLVTPMCDATAKLLSGSSRMMPRDYVRVSLEDDVYDLHDGGGYVVSTKRFLIESKSRDLDRVASSYCRSEWFRDVPGSRSLSAGGYGCTAPPTDVTALVTLARWGWGAIEFADEEAELEFKGAIMRFVGQTRWARAQAGYKKFKSVPNRAPRGKRGLPAMPHQQVAAYCASRNEAYALWMEQSTGKTYTAIMAIDASCRPDKCQFVMIACPKNVRTQWELEIDKFSAKRTCVIQLRGGRIMRQKLLLDAFKAKMSGDYDWVAVIVSYQSLSNTVTAICAYPWDWALVDEGHFIKSAKSKRGRAACKLRDHAKRRLGLTGTPVANTVFDLYNQLEFLGRGWSGFTSRDQFKAFYGKFKTDDCSGKEWLVGVKNIPLLQERLARCSFTIKKSEVFKDMPPKTYEVIDVEMTPEQTEIYNALATQLYAEIERDLAEAESKGKTITVTNVLTRMLRLAQVTSGFTVLDPEADPVTGEAQARMVDRLDPNPKLEQLVETLKGLDPSSKVLIWCCFVQDIKTIKARLDIEGIACEMFYGGTKDDDRESIKQRFNEDPTLRVIVGNPAAGGVGMNAQGYCNDGETKCDIVIFYSQGWSSVERSQGEERPRGYVHESQTKDGKRAYWSIRCIDLCVPQTIDMTIRKRVIDKRSTANTIQDVRDILASLVTNIELEEKEAS